MANRSKSSSSTNLSGDKRKDSIKKNSKTLADFLGEYSKKFTKPIDEIWDKYDDDKNNLLDKEEAKPFMDEIATIIEEGREKNYDPSQFDELFNQMDEDHNGFLSKGEMAQFIKTVFKKKTL